MKAQDEILEGSEFSHSYPFIRETVALFDGDGYSDSVTWRPGCRFKLTGCPDGGEKTDSIADGIGHQILSVVAVFKPGRYPKRVFFVRQWRDPSGKIFGKKNLRIIGISAFRSMLRGYRHGFNLAGAK